MLGDLLHLANQVQMPSLHHFGTADDYIPVERRSAVVPLGLAGYRGLRIAPRPCGTDPVAPGCEISLLQGLRSL